MKICLITICIGEKYLQQYNTLFRPSQEKYAKKCGYDFKVITDYIDGPIHPHMITMQKWLVCDYNSNTEYDFIIFIDADIIINENTPPIHNEYNFGDKIGVVNQSQPTLQARIEGQIHKGYEVTANDYYKKYVGVDFKNVEHIINSGVLVLQPKYHKIFLRTLYNIYKTNRINNQWHYEQSTLGYEIQKNNMHYFMDMKWNALWANNKYYFNTMKKKPLSLQQFYDTNYFTHLAGHCDYHLIPTLKK